MCVCSFQYPLVCLCMLTRWTSFEGSHFTLPKLKLHRMQFCTSCIVFLFQCFWVRGNSFFCTWFYFCWPAWLRWMERKLRSEIDSEKEGCFCAALCLGTHFPEVGWMLPCHGANFPVTSCVLLQLMITPPQSFITASIVALCWHMAAKHFWRHTMCLSLTVLQLHN